MAGRGWTRQWALALFALSAAVVTGGEEKAGTQEKEPGRQFNSKLPFRVLAQSRQSRGVKSSSENYS